MGNFFSCQQKDKDVKSLTDKLNKSKKNIEILKIKNNKKYDEIVELTACINDLNYTLNRYNDVLNKPKIMANAILKSDLNCKWMNDDLEKEYIISIIKFINVACNDITGLA